MQQMDQFYFGRTTFDSYESATGFAKKMIRDGIGKCVQVLQNPLHSFYVWKGEVCESIEFQVQFKIYNIEINQVELWIRKNHPYEVPQIHLTKIDFCNDDYLEWMKSI